MSKIFLSYRRNDSAAYAQVVYSDLVQHFSQDQVFMDVDTVPPGVDFLDFIQKAVAECDVLIAFIGNNWAGCWHDNYNGAPTNSSAWKEPGGGDCARRVLRGGSWSADPVLLRASSRFWRGADYRKIIIGFRLAQDID